MEDYKTKYEIALKKVYELYRDWPCVSGLIDVRKELEEIFPELKELEEKQ
jgi:PII-like signaling protein